MPRWVSYRVFWLQREQELTLHLPTEVTSGLVTRTVTPTSYATAVVVPTPAGFRPISDTMAPPGDDSEPVAEPEERGFARAVRDRRALYPQRVLCTKRATVTAATRTVTSPVSPALSQTAASCIAASCRLPYLPTQFPTITLAPATSLKTSTVLTTKVTTVYAGGVFVSSVSIYDYSPVTTLTTETVAATTTVTASTVVATPTTYAACGADNIFSGANGDNVQTWYNRDPLAPGLPFGRDYAAQPFGSIRTAEQCCGLCQRTATCAASAWNGVCYLLNMAAGQSCAKPFSAGFYLTASDDTPKFQLSNGPCGAMYNRGSVASFSGK